MQTVASSGDGCHPRYTLSPDESKTKRICVAKGLRVYYVETVTEHFHSSVLDVVNYPFL